ncbi:MAG: hypothetical protein R2694_03425 [Ilumatobacteraceae bacterium]
MSIDFRTATAEDAPAIFRSDGRAFGFIWTEEQQQERIARCRSNASSWQSTARGGRRRRRDAVRHDDARRCHRAGVWRHLGRCPQPTAAAACSPS